ncbi:MAG TPA: ABC transporter permease, partial [Bryobacteraceae bacterium]|nr:ABC transporter permease [Bryobacteraceae bacterium]
MRSVKELWRRLRYLGRLSRFNAELDSEISFHIDCRAAELIEEGFAPDEARARARREFGSSRRAVEETREAWQVRWLEELVSDVRYAARAFCRNPGFALTAVVCLALGIGANTTMFSITTNLLFSQPSCRDAGSLVDIWEGGNSESPVADLRFVRDAHILEDVAGTNVEREMNWRDGNRTRRLFAALVTDNYFGMVGAPFRLGRGIAPGETNTAVLAERIWRSRFDSDPAILGHKLVLDGRVYTIVGILPADNCSLLGFGFSTDVYTPVLHDDDRVGFYARMPHGMTRAMARERLRSVFEQLDRIRPKEGGWKRARDIRVTGVSGLETLGQEMMGPVLAFFAMLMILVGLVLLIACTNVASLLLARASSRSQELAVRLSLGASRARIIRHLLAESLLLAVLGAVAGLLLNFICARAISNITLPLPVPIHISISPDARLLAYSVV